MTEAIADEFERWLSRTLTVAGSARRDPDAWQAVRRAWLPGVPAIASYLGEAAHPSQVREVLVAMHAAYAARLPPEADGESEAMRDFRRRRLPDFVRDETSAYIARVRPQPDIRSLFAQAAAGVPQAAAGVPQASAGRPQAAAGGRLPPRAVLSDSEPSVTVRVCHSCGAAREIDTVYGRCAFCGTPFFPQPG